MKTSYKFALGLVIGTMAILVSAFTVSEDTASKALVNPQWFTYNLDPADPNFASAKLASGNYTATGNTSQSSRPCPSSSSFCSIYAETVDGQPNLATGQPVRTALNGYTNGSGEQTLIDEQN